MPLSIRACVRMRFQEEQMPAETAREPGRLARWLDSDVGWSFRRTPVAWLSALLLLILILQGPVLGYLYSIAATMG